MLISVGVSKKLDIVRYEWVLTNESRCIEESYVEISVISLLNKEITP